MNARLLSRLCSIFSVICVLYAGDPGNHSKIKVPEDHGENTRNHFGTNPIRIQFKSSDENELYVSRSGFLQRSSRQADPRFRRLNQNSDIELFTPLETPVARKVISEEQRLLLDPTSRGNVIGTTRSLPIWSFLTNTTKFNSIFSSDEDNILQRFLTYLRTLYEQKTSYLGYNVGRRSANLEMSGKYTSRFWPVEAGNSEPNIATMHYTNITKQGPAGRNNAHTSNLPIEGSPTLLNILNSNFIPPKKDDTKKARDANSIQQHSGSKDQKIVLENEPFLRIVRSNGDLEKMDPERIVVSEKQSREAEVKEALELEDMGRITTTDLLRYKTVTVELSSSTNLIVSPGTVVRLTFQVTNNHDLTVRHYFQARSSIFSVAYIQPANVWIQPGQSESVLVDVTVPSGASESTVDTVTLYVQGVESVEKATYLYVRSSSSTITDYNKPTISHSFSNNCAGQLSSSTCAKSQWSTEITVQDSDSGLQRVVSSPKGILATKSFVSGTKSSVSFEYSSTCCYTTVLVTATDAYGNYNSYTIDVTVWYNLSLGEIAAIVVGALLILILIILIILAVVLCIRRRKSLDLTFTQRYGSRQPPRAEREDTG